MDNNSKHELEKNSLKKKISLLKKKRRMLLDENGSLKNQVSYNNTLISNRINNLETKIDNNKNKNFGRKFIKLGTFITAVLAACIILFQTIIMHNQSNIFKKQTDLISRQNDLFSNQNDKFDSQNELFESQNILVEIQNQLVELQNEKTDLQNLLIEAQNGLFNYQNKRIDQQTNLLEADRRGSLVFLFNNVLDRIDDELKDSLNNSRILSPQLIGRIISLSQALKPYKYLQNDTIIKKAVSPERGQLFLSLVNSHLNDETLLSIFQKANFKSSEIIGGYFEGAYLIGLDLSNSVLDSSNFNQVQFKEVKLNGASLRNVKLNNAKFTKTYLVNTNMTGIQGTSLTFHGSILRNTNFTNANLSRSNFTNGHYTKVFFGEENEYPDGIPTIEEQQIILNKEKDFNLIIGQHRTYKGKAEYEGREFLHIVSNKITESIIAGSNVIEQGNFTDAILEGSNFDSFVFENCEFLNSRLGGIKFKGCVIQNTYFNKSRIDKSSFEENFFSKAVPMAIGSYYRLIYDPSFEKYIDRDNFRSNKDYMKSLEWNKEKSNYLEVINTYD